MLKIQKYETNAKKDFQLLCTEKCCKEPLLMNAIRTYGTVRYGTMLARKLIV